MRLGARGPARRDILGRLEALIGCGRAGEALAELEPLLPADTPDAWTLAALAADALGSADDRTLFLARARWRAEPLPRTQGRIQELPTTM